MPRSRHPSLSPAASMSMVRVPPHAGDLWRVLDSCQRIDDGLLLTPDDVQRLILAASERFGLEVHQIRWQIVAYLAAYVVGGQDRVLYDVQREPMLAALSALRGQSE